MSQSGVIHKTRSVGTMYEQLFSARLRKEWDGISNRADFSVLIEKAAVTHCTIKSPVPHPLSLAVKAINSKRAIPCNY